MDWVWSLLSLMPLNFPLILHISLLFYTVIDSLVYPSCIHNETTHAFKVAI